MDFLYRPTQTDVFFYKTVYKRIGIIDLCGFLYSYMHLVCLRGLKMVVC